MTTRVRATIENLSLAQIEDLRAIAANPCHPLAPIRRSLFRRLQLIKPSEARRPPRNEPGRRRAPPARAHVLTALAEQLIGLADPRVGAA